MRAPLFAVACLSAGLSGSVAGQPPAHDIRRLDGTTISAGELTRGIEALTRAADVHGLTVTVFNDGRAVYSRAFGHANLPAGTVLRTSTELYGASLSKAVFAVLVMKLVDRRSSIWTRRCRSI